MKQTKVDEFIQLLGIPEPHPSSKKFYELILQAALLHAAKQEDYGTDGDPFANIRSSAEFGVEPWRGACIRLNDKVKRLKTFSLKGSLTNEPVEDSFLDLAVYSLIALILWEEGRM